MFNDTKRCAVSLRQLNFLFALCDAITGYLKVKWFTIRPKLLLYCIASVSYMIQARDFSDGKASCLTYEGFRALHLQWQSIGTENCVDVADAIMLVTGPPHKLHGFAGAVGRAP